MRVGLQRTWPPLPRVPEAVGRGARRRRHALAPPRRLLEWPTGPSSAARRSAAVPLLLGCSCVRAEDAPSVGRAACDAFVRPCSDAHVLARVLAHDHAMPHTGGRHDGMSAGVRRR